MKIARYWTIACLFASLGLIATACLQEPVEDGEAVTETGLAVEEAVLEEENGSSGGNQCNFECDGHKVLICHIPPGNPANAHEICVGAPAVPAHLAHGDLCGPCQQCKHLDQPCMQNNECCSNNCLYYTCRTDAATPPLPAPSARGSVGGAASPGVDRDRRAPDLLTVEFLPAHLVCYHRALCARFDMRNIMAMGMMLTIVLGAMLLGACGPAERNQHAGPLGATSRPGESSC